MSVSITNCELSSVMEILKQIDHKLTNVIPRVANIESRLTQIECLDSLSEIKSSTTSILEEVRGCYKSSASFSDSVRSGSQSSDSITEVSDGLSVNDEVAGVVVPPGYGLVMSNSDMTELATRTGQLLNCKVDIFNYSQEELQPTLFDKKLEFVLIQDSGKVLDQYSELTNTAVKAMTAHVQQIVSLSSNILKVQPDTKVLLGALPPRYDGKLGADLVRVFNGLLLTESFMEEKISVVNQSQLCCKFEKKKVERFESDLVTLTRYGKKLRDKNIAVQIAEVVPGLKVMKKIQDHQHRRGYAWPGDRQKFKARLEDILRRL